MNDRMKKIFHMIGRDKKRSLLILVLVGVLLLVIAWPVSSPQEGGTAQELSSADGENGSEDGGGAVLLDGESFGGGQTLEEYVALQEERLTRLLSSVSGAGDVQVMITASATKEKVVEKDVTQSVSTISESDSGGGTRVTDESSYSETSLYDGSSGQSSEPYVIKELAPQIEGVVVAASGAGDEFVVDEITQAVSVLFNLPVHKIKVVKMES